MNRLHFLTCHAEALRSGFTHYAAAIAALYRLEYGCELLPDDRAERCGASTGISSP